MLLERFRARGIAAAQIGEIVSSPQLWVETDNDRQLFHDLATTPLTGLSRPQMPIPQQEL